MGNFNRDDRGSGGGFSRGGGSRFGGRDGGRPAMFKATCSECGKECDLPFRPTGDRPVFCSFCFEKQGGGSDRPSRSGSDRYERPERPRFEDRQDRQMHDAVCSKCGKDCQVPFRPTAGKPIFCENCFEKPSMGGGRDSGELAEQVKMLNIKMDKLIKILAPNAVVEETKKPEVKKEVVAKETVKEVVKEKVSKAKDKVAAKKVPAKKKK